MPKTIKARYHIGRSGLLDRQDNTDLTVPAALPKSFSFTADPNASTAGAWKDILDCQAFEQEVYAHRLTQPRAEVRL